MPRSKEMDLPIRFEASPILFDATKIAALMGYNGKPPANQPMGHVPPPPPARRPRVAERPTSDLYGMPVYDSPYIADTGMAQSARATAENVTMVQAAINLAQSSGISTDEAMRMLERAVQVPNSAAAIAQRMVVEQRLKEAKPKNPPGIDLANRPKRKITLE